MTSAGRSSCIVLAIMLAIAEAAVTSAAAQAVLLENAVLAVTASALMLAVADAIAD